MYVYSGELILCENKNILEVGAHECIFLKRGSTVNVVIHSKNEEHFNATYIRLRKCILKDFFRQLDNKEHFADNSTIKNNTFKVTCTPDIKSLFYSILPYYKENVLPTPVITRIKLQAGIFSLLYLYEGFYTTLFDFRDKLIFNILYFTI